MVFKALGIGGSVLLGGLYVTGAIGGGGWSRDVSRPQAEVMGALENLDIRDQPASPAADAGRSGVRSVLKVERSENSMRWVLMNGNRVTLRMIADFKPIDGGRQTHVTAHVERGDAPDAIVAPAFRSNNAALGLFETALEGALNNLARPDSGSFARDVDACARLFRQFQEENLAASARGSRDGIGMATAKGARLRAYDARQRQLGCGRRDSGDSAPGEIAAMAAKQSAE
ncbi:hypothetical protein GCM10009087_41090 [Sphingomonas oligophenolica]|uniref:DUF922 domain-containing protein n=1 Tax=Sphingomonas oligophenolica TaxID=301154 RepID=A0ABU9Y1V7_9SPHN